jgi:hypothetical protein
MPSRGEQHAADIREGLTCPECEYSLRGLPGDEVTCPECGRHLNLARLVASRWTHPWHKAPLYDLLAVPLAVAFAVTIATAIAVAMVSAFRSDWLVVFAVVLIGAGCWAASLRLVRKRFGSAEGVHLALLVHIVLPMYVFGAMGVIGFGVKISSDVANSVTRALPFDLLILLLCVSAIVIGRVIERFVAGRCIRRFLRLRAAVDTMAA